MADSSSCGTPGQYQIPVNDSSCAIPTSDKYTSLMEKCCGSAPVTTYDNDCASYCLAIDQTVKELTDCLYDDGKGVAWQNVWCSGGVNDTATGKPTSTEGEVSETGSSESGTGTDSAAEETSTGAASGLRVAGGEGWGASSVVVLGLAAFWGLGAMIVGVQV
ncbi:hypothetical protein FQN54_004346 [Arachnomyces sp. PD_36]|nr:hypothetical protein FQN54_004346 [Arachnomyces sp. PD_36]